ncbi:MAG: hypothetical protein AB8B74_09745 [Crocinitomicaceae bacterium]
MKKFMYLFFVGFVFISCVKKNTYQCEVVHHLGGFLGVQEYTSSKKFRGTPAQKQQYEIDNSDSTKTTTCY